MSSTSLYRLCRALTPVAPLALLALVGCTAQVEDPGNGNTGAATGSGSVTGAGASGGANPMTGGVGGAGATAGSGVGGATAGTGNAAGAGGTVMAGTGGTGGAPTIPALCVDPAGIQAGRAPLRRLTIYELNRTVLDVFGDTTNPARILPPEQSGNGFGNDAAEQSSPALLIEGYVALAEGVASRATATPAALGTLASCASNVAPGTEATCARTIIDTVVPRAYRRPLVAGEAEEYVTLFQTVHTANGFASGIAAVIEAVLQSPDFLYRVEFGVADTVNPALKRPTGPEMATRLSYFLTGSSPDPALTVAAGSGELLTNAGVYAQAQRLLTDPKARDIVTYFFDNLLPISNITDVARDLTLFPTFSSTIGAAMREETRTFVGYEVFEGTGTLPGLLTAPYTFVNQALAGYYGMTGIVGTTFQQANLDTTQRLGLLTQGAVLIGTTPTNYTNPVRRGALIVNQFMCRGLELPPPDEFGTVTPPEPYTGSTGRERYTIHSSDPKCAGCHTQMDPIGFALENYDAVGLFRTTENGVMIDPSGEVPDMVNGAVSGPIELAQKLALNGEVHNCFASKWLDYAYGQTLHTEDQADQCNREQLGTAFRASAFNIKQMLVDLTQTDGFLYLGAQQ